MQLKLVGAARVTLGLVFTVFGLNGFLQFLPMPPLPAEAGAYMGALVATGYMVPLIKATEVVAGLMLLVNRRVPLALVLLAPIVVNIVLFHLVLTPFNPVTALVLGLELALAWAYRDNFRGVLQSRATVSVGRRDASAVGRTAAAH